MATIVGQTKLLSKIDSYNFDTLPHSIIFEGKKGSGKHTLVSYLGEKINLPVLDITEYINDDYIENIYREVNPKIYIVNSDLIKEKDQNMLLKFFEEPPLNAYIILLSSSIYSVLPTIKSRGFILRIDKYSKEDLISFCDLNNFKVEENILDLCEVPGDISKIYTNNINIEEINKLCGLIVDKLSKASFPNTLTIAEKINYKDEFDKIDLDFFIKILYNKLKDKYLLTKDSKYLDLLKIVFEFKSRLYDPRLNKDMLIRNMLCNMWEIVH